MNLAHTPSPPDAEALYTELVRKILANHDQKIVLVGIHTGGAWLAERLFQDLTPAGVTTEPLGMLSVSFHRDDFDKIGLHTQQKSTDIPFSVDAAHILLVDDVLQSGRTVRAAINELFDYGRPASISLAVLVDRGNRELPICAQYVGATLLLPTEKSLSLNHDEHGKFYWSLESKSSAESIQQGGST